MPTQKSLVCPTKSHYKPNKLFHYIKEKVVFFYPYDLFFYKLMLLDFFFRRIIIRLIESFHPRLPLFLFR